MDNKIYHRPLLTDRPLMKAEWDGKNLSPDWDSIFSELTDFDVIYSTDAFCFLTKDNSVVCGTYQSNHVHIVLPILCVSAETYDAVVDVMDGLKTDVEGLVVERTEHSTDGYILLDVYTWWEINE